MADVYIRFPVTCPVCGEESLTACRAETIIDSLDARSTLALTSVCHGATWLASPTEEEQIREYLFMTIGFTKSSEPWMTSLDQGELKAAIALESARNRNPGPRG